MVTYLSREPSDALGLRDNMSTYELPKEVRWVRIGVFGTIIIRQPLISDDDEMVR